MRLSRLLGLRRLPTVATVAIASLAACLTLLSAAPAAAAPAWHVLHSSTSGFFTGASFPSPGKGWAVGNNEIFVSVDGGESWSSQYRHPADARFQDVWFVDDDRGWAVGHDGLIVATEDGGETWATQRTGGAELNDVWFIDADRGWAVGEEGTILATSDGGEEWVQQTSGTTQILEGVSFASADHGWAVGFNTVLGTSDGGETWAPQFGGWFYLDVFAIDAERALTVGNSGITASTSDGGASWTELPSGVPSDLGGVWFEDADTGWTVGEAGTILTTVDGGETWEPQHSGTSEALLGVKFDGAGNGAAWGMKRTVLRYYDATVASRFDVSAPGSATAGSAFDYTVTARDAAGRPASEFAGTVGFGSSDSLATLPPAATLTDGTGTFSATARTAGQQTITATSGSLSGISAPIAVAAAPPTQLEVTAPGATTAGDAFDVTVTARDQFGNVATGYSGALEFSSSDPGAVLPADAALSEGTGTFSAELVEAGAQTITVTSGSLSDSTGPISVSAANLSRFLVSAPSAATVGEALDFSVTALDAFGNVVTDYDGAVGFTSTDPAATLPAAGSLADGEGLFEATLRTAGEQTITASQGSATGTSAPVAVGKVSPSISASASPGITIGGQVSDTATLSSGFNPTGTITFSLYGPDDVTCAGAPASTDAVTVSDNGAYQPPGFPPTAAGTYRWTVSYSGDANNQPLALPCNSPNQSVVVAQAAPDLASDASPDITIGGALTGSATLSAGFNPTGTITFSLFGPGGSECTGAAAFSDTVQVDGNGAYEPPEFVPTAVGEYRWAIDYSGDANNEGASNDCEAEAARVTVAKATTATELTSSRNPATTGEAVTFAATVIGHQPSGTVTFRNGATVLGASPLDAAGKASFTTAALSAHTHQITATYAGDHNNHESASAPLGQEIQNPPLRRDPPSHPAAHPPAAPVPGPEVRLTYHPNRPHKPNPKGGPRYTFRFADAAPGVTFYCRLDKRPFKPCGSPKVYRNLKRGRHVFQVKSRDAAGVWSPVQTVRFRAGARR